MSNWKVKRGGFFYETEIPANTRATLYLPASGVDNLTEGGRPLSKVAGVRFLRMQSGRAVIALQSGNYHFISQVSGLEARQTLVIIVVG